MLLDGLSKARTLAKSVCRALTGRFYDHMQHTERIAYISTGGAKAIQSPGKLQAVGRHLPISAASKRNQRDKTVDSRRLVWADAWGTHTSDTPLHPSSRGPIQGPTTATSDTIAASADLPPA